MSARYVWSKQGYTIDEVASTVTLMRGTYSPNVMDRNTIVGYCCTEAEIKERDSNGRITSYSPAGNIVPLHFGEAISASEYPYFFPSQSGAQSRGYNHQGKGYWYGINDYESASSGYTAAVIYNTSSPSATGVGEISFSVKTLTPGGYGTVWYVSSSSSDAYPSSTSGANVGNSWYKYLGSDSIDPTSISASGIKKPGDTAKISITPGSSAKYGGTISYLYQYCVNGGNWEDIQTTSDVTINFAVPMDAETIQFRVRAQDDIGFTSETYVTGDNLALNTAPTAPASVSLPALVSSAQSFTVTWAASTDAEGNLSGYQVEKSYNNGSTWVSVSASVKTTSVTDTVTAGNKTVMYRVRALDTEGLFSDWAVSAASTINTAPAAPGAITVPALINCNQNFTISWTASTDVDGNLAGYQVERSYDNGSTWISIGNVVRETSTTTTVTEGNTAVLYRVRAYDDGGLYSEWTVSQGSVINQPPTAPPEITLGTVRYGEYATLVWLPSEDPDGNISSYTLQRSVNGGGFETVYTGTALTFTDRSENWDWVNVQYRVQAVDNQGGLSAWILSPKRTVQPGQLYLTGSELDLGRVVRSFDFTVAINASGEFPVSGIQVAVSLDGEERLNQQVNSGDEVVLPIDLWFLNAGEHTITITASREKFLSAEGTYRFTVVPIELGEGGRLERLENRKGQAVYPVTLMEGIFRRRDGKSLESILDTLGGGGTGGDTPGTGMDITKIQVEVKTLPAGSAATVELTGSSASPTFHFGIPRGADGKPGKDGDPGQKGDPGNTPFIGENGNWWIGTTDTGVKASPDSTETSGVQSFNGRKGAVVPKDGDYTAEMVGARAVDWMPTAEDIGARSVDWMPLAEDVGARPDTWTPSAADVGAVEATSAKDIQVMTQAEYDALASKSPTTLYLIKE